MLLVVCVCVLSERGEQEREWCKQGNGEVSRWFFGQNGWRGGARWLWLAREGGVGSERLEVVGMTRSGP